MRNRAGALSRPQLVVVCFAAAAAGYLLLQASKGLDATWLRALVLIASLLPPLLGFRVALWWARERDRYEGDHGPQD